MPIFLFFVLCQNSNKKAEIVQVFPLDTIPMQYSPGYPNFCIPVLDGIVNDSLHFKVFFDTHAGGSNFSISDSLKNLFDSNSAFVQIGKIKKQMGINFYRSNQRSFITVFGKNTIMVGWKFFDNKIIAFDFNNQHNLVYDELPNITEYSKIKITQSQNSKLLIPAQVVLQGKTLEDSVIIDTGYNGYVTLSSKHIEKQGIYTIHSYSENSMTCPILSADTIKIGNLYLANQNMLILCSNRSEGSLGTKALEDFSVILDLINYDLYLKKIDR
jgi:predicted aspartyl protease